MTDSSNSFPHPSFFNPGMHGVSKRFLWYDNWREEVFVCPYCKWTGTIAQMSQESYHQLFDASCPKCWTMLAIVSFPSYEDTRQAASRGNPEAIAALPKWEEIIATSRVRKERFENEKLKSIEQLPDVEGHNLHFVLDVAWEDDTYFELKLGDTVLWKEFAWYPSIERLSEFQAFLKAKFGERFAELKVTPSCEVVVYDL